MSTTRLITPVRLIAVALALVLALTVLVSTRGDDDAATVYGTFVDASPLEVGSEVRASGVKVGTVASIELDGKLARVGLDIDDAVLPLHRDATMTIRPINLLGENFVQVEPGSPDAPVLEGTLPVEQTRTDITLQAVLDTFDDPTSTGLAALVSELGNGVAGRGEEVAYALQALGPAMQQIDRLGDVLRGQNELLDRLVANADPVARAVSGEDGAQLDALIEQTKGTLRALAVQRTGLEQTIAQLPGTLAEAQRTLGALDRVAASTAPTLRRARPITGDLEQIAREVTDFSAEATPAFASFDEVFAQADALLAQVQPAVAALRPRGPALARVGRNLRPAFDEVVDQHLGDLMAFVRKWSLSTNGRDAISHYFRGVFHVTPEALNSLIGSDVIPPVVGPSPGDGNSTPDDVLPDIPSLNIPGLPPLGGMDLDGLGLGGLLGGRSSGAGSQGSSGGLLGGLGLNRRSASDTSATGLTTSQEQSLLTQLLGSTGAP